MGRQDGGQEARGVLKPSAVADCILRTQDNADSNSDSKVVKKGISICCYQVAELLGSKEADGVPMECRFDGVSCKYRHIASLKEITRAEAKSILGESLSARIERVAQDAGTAAKGVYKDE